MPSCIVHLLRAAILEVFARLHMHRGHRSSNGPSRSDSKIPHSAFRIPHFLFPLLALLPIATACSQPRDDRDERELLMVEVECMVEETSHELGFDLLDPEVREAMLAVPRHAFMPRALRPEAYRNYPLPIGAGQTISQPYIVAIMTQLLQVEPGDRVYELGTGSGYQAAVLAELGAEVYSVEIVPELAERAQETLKALGYDKVHVRVGDGYLGWPEAAPFAGILITAAGEQVPEPLVAQLAEGGRLVMPVGPAGAPQDLVVLTKQADGTLERRSLLPVRFVPITGDHAEQPAGTEGR
jgi:protein-L-isoaspartate(D-aspartate) O-methyltransferase